MSVRTRARHYRARAKQRLVTEAGELWMRHRGPFERLGDLTSIAASQPDPIYLFSTLDRVISPEVFAHSAYEENELRWVLDLLDQPQKNRTVVEVGANIGTTTIPLLLRYGAARVEAFEPGPDNYDLLRCNLILNHVDNQAITHPVAISDTNGEVKFELCRWNFGDHRVRTTDGHAGGFHGESDRSIITVQARRLDDAVTTPMEDIGLVWVDAQGHEAHILDGAEKLLSLGVPWIIEYWPYGLSRQNGLVRLNLAIAGRFSHVIDVRQSRRQNHPVRVATSDLDQLAADLGDDYTDLILVPQPPVSR
ncbi:MAG: FkbM family methyltransferase [Acidimicrobiales bacterium]